jgi:hypothetical protein
MKSRSLASILASVTRAAGIAMAVSAAATPGHAASIAVVPLIEFHNATLNHYFITADAR